MAVKLTELGTEDYRQVASRYRDIRKEADRTRRAASFGRGYRTEDPKRLAEKEARLKATGVIPRTPFQDTGDLGRERKIGATNDILTIETLEMGLLAKRCVGRVDGLLGDGSAFLVGEGLAVTNSHVIETEHDAKESILIMGDEDRNYVPNPPQREFGLLPERFFCTDPKLDITIVAVDDSDFVGEAGAKIGDYGYLPLIADQGKAIRGDALNIVHHPDGGKRSITLHNGNLLYLANGGELDPYFWHSCDTLPGSSGAPVFNIHWEVVGVHRRGVPHTDENNNVLDRSGHQISNERFEAAPEQVAWIANEAIRASRVVQMLSKANLSPEMDPIRKRVLELWGHRRAVKRGLMAAQKGLVTAMTQDPG